MLPILAGCVDRSDSPVVPLWLARRDDSVGTSSSLGVSGSCHSLPAARAACRSFSCCLCLNVFSFGGL